MSATASQRRQIAGEDVAGGLTAATSSEAIGRSPHVRGPSAADAGEASARRSGAQRAALGMIRAYQALRSGSPSPCRFIPSCSAYTAEAIERFGLWRGMGLGLRRIGRCRPFGGRGVDLVPDELPRPSSRKGHR
ncbi:MAG: membrane protein insertion efficiency factor YidD [Actinomycetota bacterium]|nr:membrane protein insertion efficiency factor YidD [Actinomycetota bacterium]